MIFSPPLRSATLIKRYKRFLADVITRKGKPLRCTAPIPAP